MNVNSPRCSLSRIRTKAKIASFLPKPQTTSHPISPNPVIKEEKEKKKAKSHPESENIGVKRERNRRLVQCK